MIKPIVLASLLMAGAGAQADGLADLKAVLARLPAQSPLRASLELKTHARHGEGTDADVQDGNGSVTLEDGPRGLQVSYARELLARMDAEAREQLHDPKSRTPTLWAVGKLEPEALPAMLSAAAPLARRLEEARFKGEQSDAWQGRPARLLSFTIPDTHLTDQQRKYVKHFEGALDVWIAADGTPLASRERVDVSGSAFVVVSFEAHNQDDCTYAVVGDRLVVARREMRNTSSGAGEKGEQRVVKTLQPLS